jgi:hypothetical protein
MAAVSLLVQQNLTQHLRPRVFYGLMCRIRSIYNCARCTCPVARRWRVFEHVKKDTRNRIRSIAMKPVP